MNEFMFFVWYYYHYVVNSVYNFYRELIDRVTIPPSPCMVYKVMCIPIENNSEIIEINSEKDMTREYHEGKLIRPTPE